jgi:hypothetical protein
VQNSYFYGGGGGGSVTYTVESYISSDNLIQNNIMHQVNVPVMMGPAQGTVVAYNYSVNQVSSPATWFSAGIWEHDAEVGYVLFEGNVMPGLTADTYHGNSNFNTLFRNRFLGAQYGTSAGVTTKKTQNRAPVALWSYNRYHNIVGNVLGSPQDQTVYSNSTGNGGDGAVYNLGGGNSGGSPATANDSMLAGSTMIWGNYDSANAASRFVAGENGNGATSFPALPTPSFILPASFYLSSMPSWWTAGKAWPAIGPDVAGGNLLLCASGATYADTLVTSSGSCGGSAANDAAGKSNSIPSMDCYLNTMSGPPDGRGGVLTFNPNTCYTGTTTGTGPAPPTGVTAVPK